MSHKATTYGPLFVAIGASMWAIDAIFRTQLTFAIPTAAIIFIEHLIGFLILLPFTYRSVSKLKSLSRQDWIVLLLMTIVSSVLGTLLFTSALSLSFSFGDFASPVLLQQLQPMFVIIVAALFLHERITLKFSLLAAVAIFGAYLINFGFVMPNLIPTNKELVFAMSIMAALCWGSGTVLSKKLLDKITFMEATQIRFLLAIPVSALFMFILEQTYNPLSLSVGELFRFIMIGGVTGGIVAILIYYYGLQRTQAKVATIAELSFPLVSILIAATVLNPYGSPQSLTIGNVIGICLLLASIILVSIQSVKDTENSKVK